VLKVPSKQRLFVAGKELACRFCVENGLMLPIIYQTTKDDWNVGACAYYRPDTERNRKWTKPGIHVCVDLCANKTCEYQVRNWNWPGNTTDRTPYGVVAHELGHHVDWTLSERKGTYQGDYSTKLRARSGEPPISSYCPDDGEWFAEMFRVFCTNHALLMLIRSKTYDLMRIKLTPVSDNDWVRALGAGCPERIIRAAENKIKQAKRGVK
jgi:hypothetical protein